VTPQNVVVRGARAVGLIDFDLAGPSTRFKDSFNTAMHWAPLRDPADAWDAVDPFRRLRIFADAFGWTEDERRRLPQFGAEAASLSHHRMAHNARTLGGGWARMWAGGVGGLISRRGRWLEDNAGRLVESLTD
jgi:Ser/Thr protein kinase RdoA (MazF antagonist)